MENLTDLQMTLKLYKNTGRQIDVGSFEGKNFIKFDLGTGMDSEFFQGYTSASTTMVFDQNEKFINQFTEEL